MNDQQQHPTITPSPELKQQWLEQAPRYRDGGVGRAHWLIDRAAAWGADQELEACCRELEYNFMPDSGSLRSARRPKPSLAEQGLAALRSTPCTEQCHYDALFAALTRLKQLEDSDD